MAKTRTLEGDLISRQEAVDAIDALHDKPNAWLDSAVDAVMALPSAQPKILACGEGELSVPDTNVGDMISRQTVLRCLIDISYNQCKTQGEADVIDTAKTMVSVMPSTQPERRCVNCGRTVNNGGWYEDGRTRCPIEEHYALPKDGYCHLWEKRNVTDDDYPERRTDE